MATTIQIVVAGLLLLAWVAVLGRPAGSRHLTSDDQDPATSGLAARPDGVDPKGGRVDLKGGRDEAAERLVGLELPAFIRHRDRVPIAQRRRQRLLATMFATFASFFLAVAFRGTFVSLLVVMLLALTVHLGIAARIGGRIVAQQRHNRLEAAKQVARARARAQTNLFEGGPLIGAGRAGDQLPPSAEQGRRPAAGRGDRDDAGPDRPSGRPDREVGSDDPFGRAAEIASALDATTGRIRPEDLVSDLIEQAWAEEEPSSAPAPEPDPAEAVFTRPASDLRSRFRRRRRGRLRDRSGAKAKPIHIESQLDEDYPAAVNHR